MATKTYLFQITIPSVQKFISSSRKSSDLWAGSFMVSYLMKELLNEVLDRYSCKSKDEFNCRRKKLKLIYPFTENKFDEKELIANVPNVAIFTINRIDENQAEKLKKDLYKKFIELLNETVEFGIEKLFQEKLIFNEKKKNETLEIEISCLFDNNEKTSYINLARYQIKETLKLFVEYLELENLEKYKEISEDLANLINYKKKSQLPNRKNIENYKLIKPTNWKCYGNWNRFYNYEKNIKFQTGYIKGVYRCSSCGEHTIIGATLEDWKGNTIWKPLWEANPKIFNRGERLCGVCLAKRYFRYYIGGEDLGFPSTSEIGATLFKEKIWEILKANPDFNSLLIKFFENLEKIPNFRFKKVRGNPVPKLENAINEIFPTDKNLKEDKQCKTYKFFQIDGEWFIEDTWKNPNDYKTIGVDDKKANQMLKTLKEIYSHLKYKEIKKHYKPSEYYAVIMLDGDRIGEKLDKIKELENPVKKHSEFSKKLSELSKKFKDIVEENYGALIYSGGDDVLALVPVENALKCAYRIQNKFKTTLKNNFPEIHKESPFSMSGAIIYAHHKLPLNFILDEARKCEEKAKDEGKNRVCLKYIKRSLSSYEVILKWVDIKKFKNILVNKQLAYQLRSFKETFEFKENHENLKDLKPFYKKGYSMKDLGIKIRNLQENLLISLLKNKNLDVSTEDFIKNIKRIDIYKTIKIKDKNSKFKVYDFNKIENLLLVKGELE